MLMKNNRILTFIPSVTLAAALVLGAGCASHNYQQGSKTGAALTAAAGKIDDTKTRISAALGALNDLVSNPSGDLSPKFNHFNDSVAALQSSADAANYKFKDLENSGKRYFDEWEKQLAAIQNTEIKNASAARKQDVMQKFLDVRRRYLQVQINLNPFLSDLHDIQTALGTDLTIGGVNSVKDATNKATQDSVPLNASLDQLSAGFKALGSDMSSYGPAASATP